jgi:hypothetical protein
MIAVARWGVRAGLAETDRTDAIDILPVEY